VDIYLLQEHWLFDCQRHLLNEIRDRFSGVGKAVDSTDPIPPIQIPSGYGGTAILWKKELDSFITPLSVGTDRIQGIEVLCDHLCDRKVVVLPSFSDQLYCQYSAHYEYFEPWAVVSWLRFFVRYHVLFENDLNTLM
jgi:hypothetical protein